MQHGSTWQHWRRRRCRTSNSCCVCACACVCEPRRGTQTPTWAAWDPGQRSKHWHPWTQSGSSRTCLGDPGPGPGAPNPVSEAGPELIVFSHFTCEGELDDSLLGPRTHAVLLYCTAVQNVYRWQHQGNTERPILTILILICACWHTTTKTTRDATSSPGRRWHKQRQTMWTHAHLTRARSRLKHPRLAVGSKNRQATYPEGRWPVQG